jgi:hypothetical protein
MVLFRELVAARAWLAVIHHLVGACVGCVLAFTVAVIAGGVVGLPFALVGLPVLGLGLRITGSLARLERTRFAATLGEPVPAASTRLARRVLAAGGAAPGDAHRACHLA